MTIKRDDDLTVTLTHKLIRCFSGQVRTDGIVVIQFTIYDCMNIGIVVVERLVAGWGEVVYGEANVAECFNEISWVLCLGALTKSELLTDTFIRANPLTTSVRATVLDLVKTGIDARFQLLEIDV